MLAAYYVWDSSQKQTTTPKVIKKAEEPLKLKKPVLREFEKDVLKFHMTADYAEVFESQKKTRFWTISAIIYDRETKQASTYIKSNFGEMDSESGLLHLWGAVNIETDKGQELNTEELFADKEKDIVYNDVQVTVTSENDIIVGDSMHYNLTNGVLLIDKPKAKIQID